MLENSPQRPSIEKTINQLELSGKYTNDRVVSSLTFGFWTHLFSRRPFALGGQSLLQVFPLRTKGLGQRAVYNELQSIKEFRNRIAHHEAICFDKTGMKNTSLATRRTISFLALTFFLTLSFKKSTHYNILNVMETWIDKYAQIDYAREKGWMLPLLQNAPASPPMKSRH